MHGIAHISASIKYIKCASLLSASLAQYDKRILSDMGKGYNAIVALSRTILTLPVEIFFVFVIPFIIQSLSPKIGILYRYKILIGGLNFFLGCIMITIGLSLALWTIYVQIKRGLGTPIPLLPPEKLLTNGPYRYCRNPMVFGGNIYYLGISLIIGTLSAVFIVIIFASILMLSIKIGEERSRIWRKGLVKRI